MHSTNVFDSGNSKGKKMMNNLYKVEEESSIYYQSNGRMNV